MVDNLRKKNIVLVVDDEEVNCAILEAILEKEYIIKIASNGRQALEFLRDNCHAVAAIILDLIMPVMSGYEFLELYNKSSSLNRIPVIVSTADGEVGCEARCLELGAWDFVKKPYEKEVIRFRVKNAIERSQLYVLQEMRYREDYDGLTGLYKKSKFVQETERMMAEFSGEKFTMLHLDIYKFQLFNAFYGRQEGDRLLKFIADSLRSYSDMVSHIIYCREDADVFNICIGDVTKETLLKYFETTRSKLNRYKRDYDIVPVFGAYIVDDNSLPVNEMIDRARLASKRCKGNYMKNYSFYEEELERDVVKEQVVVNNMNSALENEEFILYLQPKYDLRTSDIDGAEVLVRWRNQNEQLFTPGEFIPIFERNGFIMKLDYYVWEHACQLLRKWLNEGKNPHPISVNISRVSLYNPNLVELICELVARYNISPTLLQLELTESAYTSNPIAIKEAMQKLQKNGFAVLMDDFGSGYSSLNVLKDIAVDVLKIDMKFLSDSDMPGRCENILASVVRMAKWLKMPVIAEGVEREEQVSFLKSIGCEFVQGYYFARPMPVEDYEKLAFSGNTIHKGTTENIDEITDDLWTSTSQMEILFSKMLQAVAVYEYDKESESIDIIRVNNAYYDLFGYADLNENMDAIFQELTEEHRQMVLQAFDQVVELKDVTSCRYVRELEDGKRIWIDMELKFISQIGNKYVIFGMLSDVTSQQQMNRELQKYRNALMTVVKDKQTILIVDDVDSIRLSLSLLFSEEYTVIEAQNGQEALEVMRELNYEIDMILLDMIMPVMDGRTFLQKKNELMEAANVPVIIITSDDAAQHQVETIAMGANDYIVKPLIPEVVIRRVKNVMESFQKFGEMLQRLER